MKERRRPREHAENQRQRPRQQSANHQRRAHEQDETAELIAKVIEHLIVAAAPHVIRLLREKALPVIEAEARRALKNAGKAIKGRKAPKARKPVTKQPIVVEGTVVDSGGELAVAEKVYRTDMSSAEAQARYLAALAARAFSDEQMKLVADARIVEGEGLAELQRKLRELPPEQVQDIIKAVETNPSVLSDLLAELGKVLGLDREAISVEVRKGR